MLDNIYTCIYLKTDSWHFSSSSNRYMYAVCGMLLFHLPHVVYSRTICNYCMAPKIFTCSLYIICFFAFISHNKPCILMLAMLLAEKTRNEGKNIAYGNYTASFEAVGYVPIYNNKYLSFKVKFIMHSWG